MERKVVLVTGGSSGIGLAICKYLSGQGCKVYGTSRKVNHGDHLESIPMLHLDVEDSQSIQSAVDYLIAKEGRIDVLVNNAGQGMAGALEDATNEEIESLFKINVFGLLSCCRAVIPHMRKQYNGWIINISSIAGEFGLPFRGAYSASKSAVDRLSETLRMELIQWNIRVSIVQPGDFKTNINNNRIVAAKSRLPESPYYTGFEKQYKSISNDVAKAHDPISVAKIIHGIINSDKPKMRYPAATFVQRFSISLNRVLPTHIFQNLLNKRYPVK